MPSRWIEFIKQWARDHGISYGCALSDKNMNAAYHKTYNTGKYRNDTSSQLSYQTAMEDYEVKPKPKKPKRKLIIVDEEEILEAPKPKKYIRKLDRKLILEGSTPKPKQPKRMLIIEEDEPAPKPKKAKPKRQLIIEEDEPAPKQQKEREIPPPPPRRPKRADWWNEPEGSYDPNLKAREAELYSFSTDKLYKYLLNYGYKAEDRDYKDGIIYDIMNIEDNAPSMIMYSKKIRKV